jgi:NHLM bacteriocin system ABC transporter ATP-binding protein
MPSSFMLQLEKQGRIEARVSNSPFSVEDANSVWLVRTGELDLFIVEKKNDEPFGARHHVFRVEAGQAVFGVGSYLQDAMLVASAGPDTTLWCLSLEEFRSFVFQDADEARRFRILEDWLMLLTAALSEDAAPGSFVTLEPGRSVTIRDEPSTVVPCEGVVWVQHRQGYSLFLADNTLPAVTGETFFPVTRHGWLQAAPGSELNCANTLHVWVRDDSGSALRQFHAIAVSCLQARRKKAAEKGSRLMHARRISDIGLVQSALRRLAAPLWRIPEVEESDGACNAPLFLACEAIGKKLRISMKAHPDMLRGLKLVDPVAGIAHASGIRVRNIALKGEWWRHESTPFLAFTDQGNKPVALLPRSAHSYEYYDPTEHRRGLVDAELAATLNPFGYVLYRTLPARELRTWDLLKFGLSGCKRELFHIVLMGAAAGLTGVLTPYVTGIIFDRVIPGAERPELVDISAFLFIIAVTIALFTFVRNFAVLRLEGKLDAAIQSAVWDRLLSLPVSFFREYSSGDLAQRSLGIAAIRQTLTGSTVNAILSGIFSIFSFALLFFYSWRLAVLAAILVLFAATVSFICGVLQVRRQRQISLLGGRISSMLLQFITGISKFRVSGTERRAFAAWAREFSILQQNTIKSRALTNALVSFQSVFPLAALALIFFYQQSFMSASDTVQITLGDFIALLAAFVQFLGAALMLSSALVSGLSVIPVYERARPIFRAVPEVTDVKASPGKLTGAVEVNRVSFRYKPDMPFVLRDVSIKIFPGQFVAVVGASGSGKSTLFRILLGFETPESGAVYYDQQDLLGLDIQAVRRQIGVVLQSSRPMNGSIFNNIVGSAPLSIADAWEAARLAGIEEDIKQMPMGMHTYLADGGGGISGGQRQRLMIARAIVRRPRILLFDEATSALDNHTQVVVTRSLESLQATRIVIAHRLSTVMRADLIYVMDKGAVVDSGSYAQLITKEGIFRDLTSRQTT